jgi:hypothetical protein
VEKASNLVPRLLRTEERRRKLVSGEIRRIQIEIRNGEEHILKQPEETACLHARSSQGASPEDDSKACGKGLRTLYQTGPERANEANARTAT